MNVYLLRNLINAELVDTACNYRMLPEDSVILIGLAFHTRLYTNQWQKQLEQITDRPRFVFIDGSHDPIKLSDSDLEQLISQVEEYFLNSQVFFLSGSCEHFFKAPDKVIYFPYFFLNPYVNYIPKPRQRRIGCLNRNNTPHRPWLMYHLLDQEIVDKDRDVYSVCFASPYDNRSYPDIRSWLGVDAAQYPLNFNEQFTKFGARLATHDDHFPNDHTVNHPAWHTGITIVTETEPGKHTLLTEKTYKAILGKCCWTIYMGNSGYQVLNALGFNTNFFLEHAEDKNIDPIISICRTFNTESSALEYRQSKIYDIEYNYEWLGNTGTYQLGPWFDKWFRTSQLSDI